MSKRIGIFVPSLAGGGAQRVMVLLANGFAENGHAVTMLLAKASGPYLDELSQEVRIVDLDRGSVVRSLPALAGYLRVERPDALISAMSHANVVALLARMVSGARTPVVGTEHNSTSSSIWTATDLRSRVIRTLMKPTYQTAHAVVVVASALARDIAPRLGMKPSQLVTIYNPVVTPKLSTLAGETVEHPWLNEAQAPVIVAAGRLNEQKDFETLLRAMARLRARSRPERLIILGEGEERGRLETLIAELGLSDCVDLPGFVPNPYAYMARAALFVLSSRWEGLGNVVIEAMACGTPVISTNCPVGPAEILEDGRWGTLVPVADADTLAHAMADTLDRTHHPDVRRRAAEFSDTRAVARYLEVAGLS